MDEALLQVGLPVKCRVCPATTLVKPMTDYNGWYKSKTMRGGLTKRWFCPEHAGPGQEVDESPMNIYIPRSAANQPPEVNEDPTDELYKLLD